MLPAAPDPFSLSHSLHEGGLHIVTVSGELDLDVSPRLNAALDAIIDAGGRRIVVDLTDVTYMDSSGLFTLMTASNRLAGLIGELRVVCPPGPVHRLLELTKARRIFGMFDSREAAVG